MFNLGAPEVLVIMILALIVLGPQRLPDAARQVGKAMAEIRKLSTGFQQEMKAAFDDEPEASPRVVPSPTAAATPVEPADPEAQADPEVQADPADPTEPDEPADAAAVEPTADDPVDPEVPPDPRKEA